MSDYYDKLKKRNMSNDSNISKNNSLLTTENRISQSEINSEYKKTVYIVLLKITLFASILLILLILFKTKTSNKVSKHKYFKLIFILLGLVYFYYVYKIISKFRKGNNNRYTLIQWGLNNKDKQIIKNSKTLLSNKTLNLNKECNLLKAEELRLLQEENENNLKGFIFLKNTNLINSGIKILNDKLNYASRWSI
jgi:hypothetical protein